MPSSESQYIEHYVENDIEDNDGGYVNSEGNDDLSYPITSL